MARKPSSTDVDKRYPVAVKLEQHTRLNALSDKLDMYMYDVVALCLDAWDELPVLRRAELAHARIVGKATAKPESRQDDADTAAGCPV